MRLLLLLFFAIDLMAIGVDPLLLKAQASIFPKIMLLDNDISSKLDDNKLVLSIVYSDKERIKAKKLKDMIDLEYKNILGEVTFQTRLVDIKKFDKTHNAAAYYIFDASSQKMKDVISHAKGTHRICFGYNYKDFDKGILISLFVKERTYIYMNNSVFHDYKVKFTSIFYRIAKVIE